MRSLLDKLIIVITGTASDKKQDRILMLNLGTLSILLISKVVDTYPNINLF